VCRRRERKGRERGAAVGGSGAKRGRVLVMYRAAHGRDAYSCRKAGDTTKLTSPRVLSGDRDSTEVECHVAELRVISAPQFSCFSSSVSVSEDPSPGSAI